MSWMKRAPGGAAPPPGPDQPPFSAPQSYGSQQNVYPNYQGGNPGNAQQQQYWQMPPQQQPQYNQQYGQVYQQQEYGTNANQYYQQPAQYNQNYNQGYNATQQGYQQNYYQNQGQPNYPQNKTNADSWEDNWDWGWEDSAKQAQKAQQQIASQNAAQLPTSQPQQVFNNANVIEESFATTDSWNWAMEDKKDGTQLLAATVSSTTSSEPATLQHLPIQSPLTENKPENDAHIENAPNNVINQQSSEEVKSLNDRDVVKEHLPNLALGKRLHLDNLTPQWSIESQMSQESSDGPQTHSEGTYRSENQSRNSSKSSPGLNTDNSNFNYSQSGIEELYPRNIEWSQQSTNEPTIVGQVPIHNSTHDNHDELSSSLQEMSISNSENPAPDTLLVNRESDLGNTQENVGVLQQPPPTASPANLPAQLSLNQAPHSSPSPQIAPSPVPSVGSLPPPSSSSATLPPPSSSSILPPSSSTTLLPPPKNLPPTMPSQNPYKLSGPFSHKNISKSTSSNPPTQQYPSQSPSANLTSPSVVNKVSQHNRVSVGFGANLETTPDNSERPDQPQVTSYRPMPVTSQIPENLEIAPQNDRNEYLQTAHLSSGDYGENTDFSRNIPPPGLRRMVVGQQESEYSQNLNLGGDEPPPGLSRMVPGQQNETQSLYNQPNDNFMDRHIDGQPMESGGRPYRQAEGQQTSDTYSQPPSVRSSERRPVGLDRMVPGESSSNDYSQYQTNPFMVSNEQRVVTGEDHEYPVSIEPGLSDVREQIMDGSEYIEQPIRNPSRSVIGARESSNDTSPDFSSRAEEQQREIVMEGENLQDLSMISSGDLTFSREQTVDGADLNATDSAPDRKSEAPESLEHTLGGSRRQSLSHVNTSGEDTSERDRLVKSSPRREKHKSSREREKEGRYSRGDRKYDRDSERRPSRDERRSDRERRDRDRDRERDESPESRRARRTRDRERERDRRDESPETRRQRRAARDRRYDTEDTDYYSDRERYHRRQREGSYTSSKPPRHEGSRYREDREYSRRYNTIERESSRGHRDRDRDRYGDRYEHKYRDIDPTRKYGNLRKERDEDRKRGEAYSPSRAESREPAATDEDRARRRAERERRRHHRNDYYAGYDPAVAGVEGVAGAEAAAGADAYTLQYQYYEHIRRTNPALYLQLYKRLVAAQPPDYRAGAHLGTFYPDASGYANAVLESQERTSLHSGRSSAALKGNDTDLNTDASLNLHLEESTVRSERMTPFRYSTAHVKGSISSRHLVVVPAMYPVDGRPARVTVAALATLLANDPAARALRSYPGPLVSGVTHKKSVIEYCMSRAAETDASRGGRKDSVGRALMWQLLALLLRQNGVVVGTDIAELLMANTRQYPHPSPPAPAPANTQQDSRRESPAASAHDEESYEAEEPLLPTEQTPAPATQAANETDIENRFRELLISGNRQEALEFAMDQSLWGHALTLAWHSGGRARAAALSRFVGSIPAADPLHSLYCGLGARVPPAATCVSSESWGDWRPHAAILLANPSARPDHDRRTLIQLGDSLLSRGLIYSAQFCFISGGAPFTAHPRAPFQPPAPQGAPPAPRLALLLADHRANTFEQFATNEAIFATEIYEYALSLNQDYVIKEFQVYKLLLATRLMDVGLYERALAYTEQAAKAVTRAPRDYPAPLLRALAALADRLKYDDPALQEEALGEEGTDSGEPSPRHRQWVDDVTNAAQALTAQSTPQHQPPAYYTPNQYAWGEQAQQYQQSAPAYSEQPASEEAPDYGQYYQNQEYRQQTSQEYEHQAQEYGQQNHEYAQQSQEYAQQNQEYGQQNQEYGQQQTPEYGQEQPPPPETDGYGYGYEDRSYGDNYWQGQNDHYGYGEAAAGAEAGGEARPMITMPGTKAGGPSAYDDDDRPPSAHTDRETDTPKGDKKSSEKSKDEGSRRGGGGGSGSGGGWLGGILTRLSLRPPNQMILPDDKNPTIVWDAENKRWRNLDGDDDVRAPPPPPPAGPLPTARAGASPPAAPEAPGGAPALPAAGVPPPAAPPTSNIFKMQKSRHIKKSYVDVFNPSGAPTRALPPAADVLGPAGLGPAPGGPAAPARLFVPGPVNAQAPHQGGIYDPQQAADETYQSGI